MSTPRSGGLYSENRYVTYLLLFASYAMAATSFYLGYSFLAPLVQVPRIEVTLESSLLQEPLRVNPFIWYIFLAFAAMTFLNDLAYFPMGFYHEWVSKKRRDTFNRQWKPYVSIVVPAHNEERVIEGTVEALLSIAYPNKEIIVVNDGSTDRTEQIVRPYALQGKLSLINLPHGGKTFAMNVALKTARSDYIVIVDADSHMERMAITNAMPHFEDPTVAAVAANAKVGNKVNLLSKLQALEYVRGINLRRRAFDLLNCVDVIPGAGGIFRKDAVAAVGGFDLETITEDMDLTVKLLKPRDKVRYEPTSICYTETPKTYRDWMRQRVRWCAGNIQVFSKHRRQWWHFGTLNLDFAYLLLSIFFVPLVEVGTLTLGVYWILRGLWMGVAAVIGLSMVYESVSSWVAIYLGEDDMSLVWMTVPYVLFYRYLMGIARFKALYNIYTHKAGWTRSQRYGQLGESIKIS